MIHLFSSRCDRLDNARHAGVMFYTQLLQRPPPPHLSLLSLCQMVSGEGRLGRDFRKSSLNEKRPFHEMKRNQKELWRLSQEDEGAKSLTPLV